MQRDKKVGLALAILLCSIVGAFFIRDEAPKANAPELKNPNRLDSQIAQGEKQPYSEPESRRTSASRSERSRSPWEIPDYLNPDADRSESSKNKRNISRDPADQRIWTPEAPGTVVLTPPTDDESPAVPIPDHNKEWAVRQKNGDVIALKNVDPNQQGTGSSRSHVVVAGETLSSIAGKYLGTQARYLDIFQANRDQLKSPDDLKVGMKLNIPERHSDVKSNSNQRTTSVERASPSTNKSSRSPSGSVSNKITEKSKPSDSAADVPAKKVQFKPSKTGPAIRRSAENEANPSGKSLTQTAPQDLLEVDDGILAELEKTTETIAKNASPEESPAVPRVAQADRDETLSVVAPDTAPTAGATAAQTVKE